MFSNILVATDGSGPATRAVQLAARIAQATSAKLIAISVYAEPGAQTALSSESHSGVNAARGLLEDIRTHYGAKITLETEALAGDPADVIVDEAKRHGADVIVMGDRGMSGIKHVLGSVPNKVSHHAPCHLLLAHTADDSTGDVPVTKVLLATDGSETATKAVEIGAGFADALGAKALLVTIADPDDGERILAATEQTLGRSFERRVLQGSVSETLLEVAEREGVDLIVTGSKGMQGARRFLGSVPNSVSHHMICSMLIVKTA